MVEESPSVFLDHETRVAMGQQAAALAKAVDYKSAGTVEFLMDKDKKFYFLEMNTRLQVEHPVTEEITGVDLVEQMIRVAAGYKLSPHLLKPGPIPFKGWAMETRLYAEDPLRGFLPSIGTLQSYREPDTAAGSGVRCDAGVTAGSEISMYYDPMISKLVTFGANRAEAIAKMETALDEYVIRGVGHNAYFCRDVLRNPRFIQGALTTDFIPEEYPTGFSGVKLTPKETSQLVASAAIVNYAREELAGTVSGQLASYAPAAVSDVCVTLDGKAHFGVSFGSADDSGVTVEASVVPLDGALKPAAGVEPTLVKVESLEHASHSPLIRAVLDGASATLQFHGASPEGVRLQYCGGVFDLAVRTRRAAQLALHMIPKKARDTSKLLLSPMPGSLVNVAVAEGQEVEAGQELAVVEAMKMQNVLRAEKKGRVKRIHCKGGATLAVDEAIIEFE